MNKRASAAGLFLAGFEAACRHVHALAASWLSHFMQIKQLLKEGQKESRVVGEAFGLLWAVLEVPAPSQHNTHTHTHGWQVISSDILI